MWRTSWNFDTGSLTKQHLQCLEIYLPSNDSVLLPVTPDGVLTNFDWLGKYRVSRKISQVKKLPNKPYLKNMSPKRFCYDNFSTDFIEFTLRKECCAKTLCSETRIKNGIRELCPPNLFIFTLLRQNEGFDNLRTRRFDVNKIRGKSVAEGKDRKCDKWKLHVSY